MKVYLDYVFFINLLFDFILLLGISIVLKRQIKKIRIVLGSLIGGLSGFIILLNISAISFFILKLLLGLVMILTTFSYKNIKYTMNNFIYLIILSLLQGGTLYLFNIEISKLLLKTDNRIYISLLFTIGIITTIIYTKYLNKAKQYNNSKYKTVIYIKERPIELIGYLDTGNSLTYKKRPVIILNKDIKLDLHNEQFIYVPFATVNGNGIMKCIKLKEVLINNKIFKNIYLGISNDKFYLNDSDIILNTNLKEEINEKYNRKNNHKIKRVKKQ